MLEVMTALQMKMLYRGEAYDKIEHKARGMQMTTSALGPLETFFLLFSRFSISCRDEGFLLDTGVTRLSQQT
jgi:hypothetical protein